MVPSPTSVGAPIAASTGDMTMASAIAAMFLDGEREADQCIDPGLKRQPGEGVTVLAEETVR